jgi:flavin reductase (DIM6/NTAB) family NADH-FMN oxidoreductase RutF
VKAVTPQARWYGDGGAQWAIPQADISRWPDDTSFATGPDPFRAAMRHHAKGVVVITAGTDKPIGFCATSLASVSLEPPIVSFTAGLRSSSWRTLETARHVMVHLLADSQADLASLFGRTDAGKFGPETRWHRDALGLPVLDDALAWLLIAVHSHFPVGDHAVVIGQVIASRYAADGRPLIPHNGEFVPLTAARCARGGPEPGLPGAPPAAATARRPPNGSARRARPKLSWSGIAGGPLMTICDGQDV